MTGSPSDVPPRSPAPQNGGQPPLPRSPRVALQPEPVPPPLRRSKRARHPLVVVGSAFFTFLIVVAVAIGTTLYVGRQRFEAPGPLAQDKIVNILKGLGTRDISDLLVREGVIDQPYVFVGGVVVLKARGDLKHGEYKFPAHSSVAEVIGTLIDGKVVQHAVTVAEGLTSEQIVDRLQENTVLTGSIKEIPAEGSLMPETYKFTRGTTREQVIQRMQQADKRAVQEIWEHRDPELPLKSEKDQPTPYNTYVIDGLPPGPIANPGRASLEAVAQPARTKDLYFVADGTGGHVFAETYELHQKNVAKLRALEQNAATAATPAVDPPAAHPAAVLEPPTAPAHKPAPRAKHPVRH